MNIQQGIDYLINYYKEDIINNQKLEIIGAIGPMRYVFNFAGGIFGLVQQAGKGFSIVKLWSSQTLFNFVAYSNK